MFETEIFRLVLATGVVGKAIIGFLAVLSLVCWAIILEKYTFFKRVTGETEAFLDKFAENGITETTLGFSESATESAEARVFGYGYRELMELIRDKDSPFILDPDEQWPADVTAIQVPTGEIYNMTAVSNVIEKYILGIIPLELNRLERRLSFLATVGSVAPLIGLFGTVSGILASFQSIASQQSASLATVAPGIAEALLTTVAGLITAVPALVAYNFFLRRVRRAAVELDCYVSLFITRLQSRGLR